MTKKGVLYVKYKDDKAVKNAKGIAVHLFQDVTDYGFLAEGINLLKIELDNQGGDRDAVYIPLSNVALIEYFESMKKFNQCYPPGNGYGY